MGGLPCCPYLPQSRDFWGMHWLLCQLQNLATKQCSIGQRSALQNEGGLADNLPQGLKASFAQAFSTCAGLLEKAGIGAAEALSSPALLLGQPWSTLQPLKEGKA